MNARQDFFNPLVCVIIVIKQLYNDAIGLRITGKGVGFIGIHMHGKPEIPVNTDNYVSVDQTSSIAFGKDKDLIVIPDTKT